MSVAEDLEMNRHRRPDSPSFKQLASEAIAFGGADRGKAIGFMVNRLLNNKATRERLLRPMLNHVCAHQIWSMVHINRDLGAKPRPSRAKRNTDRPDVGKS